MLPTKVPFVRVGSPGLERLGAPPSKLFDPTTKKFQFSPAFGYQARIRDAGGSVIVTDLKTAVTAINIIVDQGEGNPGPYVDLDHLEKDHYAVFQELQQSSDIEWNSYPTFPQPTTAKYYPLDIKIYQASRSLSLLDRYFLIYFFVLFRSRVLSMPHIASFS